MADAALIQLLAATAVFGVALVAARSAPPARVRVSVEVKRRRHPR